MGCRFDARVSGPLRAWLIWACSPTISSSLRRHRFLLSCLITSDVKKLDFGDRLSNLSLNISSLR